MAKLVKRNKELEEYQKANGKDPSHPDYKLPEKRHRYFYIPQTKEERDIEEEQGRKYNEAQEARKRALEDQQEISRKRAESFIKKMEKYLGNQDTPLAIIDYGGVTRDEFDDRPDLAEKASLLVKWKTYGAHTWHYLREFDARTHLELYETFWRKSLCYNRVRHESLPTPMMISRYFDSGTEMMPLHPLDAHGYETSEPYFLSEYIGHVGPMEKPRNPPKTKIQKKYERERQMRVKLFRERGWHRPKV